jgi:ABC-type dipeptide/oligopeptide/nickel transport system permease component
MSRAIQDFGNSIKAELPAIRLFFEGFRHLELGIAGMVLATVGAVGILRHRRTAGSMLWAGFWPWEQSMPVFWLALMLIILLVQLKFLPSAGEDQDNHAGHHPGHVQHPYLRLTRSTFFDVIHQDYIRRPAKGLPDRVIIYQHILTAAIPFSRSRG